MKKKLALLMVIAMTAGLLLSACAPSGGGGQNGGGNESQNQGGSTPDDSQQQTEKRDSVNLSIKANLASIDAHGVRNLQDLLVRQQMYEGLYFQDEATLEMEPRVAESYEVSEDGKTYTFKIRSNAKFHNGDDVKASDVVWSWTRASQAPGWGAYTSSFDSAEAIDDKTVAIHLKFPDASFLCNMCKIGIMSEKVVTEQGDEFGTKVALAGTGPYMITYLDNDVKWTLEAFPDYYRGEAAIKTINYTPIVDFSAGLLAFESGELDWYTAPIANWNDLVANENYKTEIMAANHITYLAINWLANDELGNDYVRKAIAYSLDKESMNIAGFDGYATEANYMENPEYNVGAPDGGLVYNYDPEKSKELLAEGGFPNGVTVGKLLCFPGSHFEKCAQVAQANMEAVGIHAENELVEEYTALTRARAQEYDMDMTGGSQTGDYSAFADKVVSTGVGSYFVKFEGDKFDYKKFDSMFEEGLQIMDPAERKAHYQELNDMIMETACLIPVLHKAQPYVWNKNLNVVNQPNNYNVYDWSWN